MLFPRKYLGIKILCYLVLLCVHNVFSQKKYPWSSAHQEKKLVCKTKECDIIGHMYTKNLDRRKNPCTDFYEYACGNWEMANPVPPDADEWGARAVQQEEIEHKLKVLLKNDVTNSKLSRIYNACAKRPVLGQMTINKLMTYVKAIDVWPVLRTKTKSARPPWWVVDKYYIKRTGESAMFDILIAHDYEEHNHPLFQLKPLSSVYGRILRSSGWEGAEIQAYIEFVRDLIEECSRHTQTGRIKVPVKDISDVISFRLELKSIGIQASKSSQQHVRTTLEGLQNTFNYEHVKSKSEPVDWVKIMQSIYENNSPERISIKTNVDVRHYEYFGSLAKLLDNTPEEIIVNHIHLYFVERHLLLDPTWRAKLNKAIYSEHPCLEKKGRIRRLYKRWMTCIASFRGQYDFNKFFIEKFLSLEARKTVKSIIPELKSVLSLEISDSDWLDREAKDKSLSKVHDMQVWIGYPIWYDNPKLKENFKEIQMTPVEANACQIPEYNTIFLTTGILSPPMGSISDAYPATYGTVGFTLAHESYHGFDMVGITFDGKGNNHKSWWSTSMVNQYDKQRKCFMDHYQQFLLKDLKIKNPKQCDVPDVYDENMCDIMGLKLAYQLYKKALFEKQGTCYVPSQLKDFSCDQLFFLAYANTQCSTVKQHTLEYGTLHHSPPRYRVNGPLTNMEEFANAFHCKAKDDMQLPPASRYDLWTAARS